MTFFGKRDDPCGDCADGWCTMNCGPKVHAPETWFEVITTTDRPKQHYVVRLDRETLPKAVVVSGPHATKDEAGAVAVQMRETGTA